MNGLATELVSHLVSPGDLALMLLAAGILLSWSKRTRKSGLAISTIALLFFLAVAWLPIAGWVTAPLESRFPPSPFPSRVDGLIVLGGAVDTAITLARNVPTLTAEAERMTEFVRLAKLYPRARLVFAGGGGSRGSSPTLSEADVARMFFREQDLDTRRIQFEAASQNTYENVLFAKSLARPRPGENWILITSAQDVPRCIAVFRKLQWPVTPRAVAYKADADDDRHLGAKLKALDRSSHEWIGLLFYRLSGKSDELFPRPIP